MPDERSTEQPGPGAGNPAVDVQQLADRVYRLMLADARLERARRGDGDQPRTRE